MLPQHYKIVNVILLVILRKIYIEVLFIFSKVKNCLWKFSATLQIHENNNKTNLFMLQFDN